MGGRFVFAFWAVRDGFRDDTVVAKLNDSRDFGVAHIPAISDRYSELLHMKRDFVQEYLERNVYYYMNDLCLEGLRLFYERAADIGAIRSVRKLELI